MKIQLVHRCRNLHPVLRAITTDHEFEALDPSEFSSQAQLLNRMISSMPDLIIIQWGFAREKTPAIITHLRSHLSSKIWVVSGLITDEIATETISAGADKAVCITKILTEMAKAGFAQPLRFGVLSRI